MNDAIEEFRKVRQIFERFTMKLKHLFEQDLLPGIHVDFLLEYRTKEVDKFQRKITRPDKSYKDPIREVHDLSGLRIVLHRPADARKVVELVEREFVVNKDESRYRTVVPEADRFGYIAEAQLVVNLADTRSGLPEWREFESLKAEIQIRTLFQHAWDVISRRYDYQVEADIPTNLRRRLFRLSALVELADEEVERFASEAEEAIRSYRASIRLGEQQIELNVNSLKSFVETSSMVRAWNDYLRNSIGVKVETWGDLSRDVKIAHFCGISTIAELDRVLKDAQKWGGNFLTDYYARVLGQFGLHKSQAGEVTVVLNGVITMFLIASFRAKFTPTLLITDYGYGTTYILDSAAKAQGAAEQKTI